MGSRCSASICPFVCRLKSSSLPSNPR
jgi:hypothetical protein